jgi:hypothetical protein
MIEDLDSFCCFNNGSKGVVLARQPIINCLAWMRNKIVNIEIIELPIAHGDNPTAIGAPIGVGWKNSIAPEKQVAFC